MEKLTISWETVNFLSQLSYHPSRGPLKRYGIVVISRQLEVHRAGGCCCRRLSRPHSSIPPFSSAAIDAAVGRIVVSSPLPLPLLAQSSLLISSACLRDVSSRCLSWWQVPSAGMSNSLPVIPMLPADPFLALGEKEWLSWLSWPTSCCVVSHERS